MEARFWSDWTLICAGLRILRLTALCCSRFRERQAFLESLVFFLIKPKNKTLFFINPGLHFSVCFAIPRCRMRSFDDVTSMHSCKALLNFLWSAWILSLWSISQQCSTIEEEDRRASVSRVEEEIQVSMYVRCRVWMKIHVSLFSPVAWRYPPKAHLSFFNSFSPYLSPF